MLGTDVGGLFFHCGGQVLINELSYSPAADPETSGVIHRGTPINNCRLRIYYNYELWSLCMVLVVPHHCNYCNCVFIFILLQVIGQLCAI